MDSFYAEKRRDAKQSRSESCGPLGQLAAPQEPANRTAFGGAVWNAKAAINRRTRKSGIDAVDEHDAFFVIDFLEPDFDNFGGTGLHRPADILRFDGHFAMAAIDEHAKGNALRSAEVEQAVHGGANGAAGVEHVVDEDEVHAVDVEGDV